MLDPLVTYLRTPLFHFVHLLVLNLVGRVYIHHFHLLLRCLCHIRGTVPSHLLLDFLCRVLKKIKYEPAHVIFVLILRVSSEGIGIHMHTCNLASVFKSCIHKNGDIERLRPKYWHLIQTK